MSRFLSSALESLHRLTSTSSSSFPCHPSDVKSFEELLSGFLLVPLLIHSKNLLGEAILNSLDDLERDTNNLLKLLENVFVDRKWIKKQTDVILGSPHHQETTNTPLTFSSHQWQWTHMGKFVWDRVLHMGVVGSYRPLLSQSTNLLFQNFEESDNLILSCLYSANKPTTAESGENELHIDRTLNVLGSGSQHEKYFTDMQEVFLLVFKRICFVLNSPPFSFFFLFSFLLEY